VRLRASAHAVEKGRVLVCAAKDSQWHEVARRFHAHAMSIQVVVKVGEGWGENLGMRAISASAPAARSWYESVPPRRRYAPTPSRGVSLYAVKPRAAHPVRQQPPPQTQLSASNARGSRVRVGWKKARTA